MIALSQVNAALRRQNRKNYLLLVLCNFISVLLITAYVTMMRSPTVLQVLPEGGDSRKQVMMIFVLAVIGCACVHHLRSLPVLSQQSQGDRHFLGPGGHPSDFVPADVSGTGPAGHRLLRPGGPAGHAAGLAAVAGLPAAAGRQPGNGLCFRPASLPVCPGLFPAWHLAMLFWLGRRSLRRTNIIDIVNEARRSEPIRDVKRWYGPVGILLLAIGGLLGYQAPSFSSCSSNGTRRKALPPYSICPPWWASI